MYFIFDCFHNIVGNPSGYRTFKGAKIQENKPNSPARKAILIAYANQTLTSWHNLISQIKWIETGDNTKQALINYYINR